jgi:hypothetical protein
MGAIKAPAPATKTPDWLSSAKTIARCSIASCGFYEQVSLGETCQVAMGHGKQLRGDSTVGGG